MATNTYSCKTEQQKRNYYIILVSIRLRTEYVEKEMVLHCFTAAAKDNHTKVGGESTISKA
jgi:hypothetical protein